MNAYEVDELKVYPLDGRAAIHVPEGRGEELRIHLESHGIPSRVSPLEEVPYERLEVEEEIHPDALQAIVDLWER